MSGNIRFTLNAKVGGETSGRAPEYFSTEKEALKRAAELYEQYGDKVVLDLWADGTLLLGIPEIWDRCEALRSKSSN